MAQAVCSWPLTADTRLNLRPSHVRYMVVKVALGQVFLPVLRLSPACIIPTNVPQLRRTNGRSLRILRKSKSNAHKNTFTFCSSSKN
jgi:hypothetical protein